ncbi:MAG: hypothetical protein IKM67_02520, partial [Clostridia bacterium]|nr:hypothetical protein [Clostridia bacterium]
EAFDAWIFDEARKVGDTAVVETEHGYHVMYFEGAGELQYIVNIKNTIASEKYTEKYTAFSEGMEAKDHNFGMMLAF